MYRMKHFMMTMLAIGMMAFPAMAESDQPVRVTALKGPTAMGLVKMMSDDAASEAPVYQFDIAGSPDLVAPLLAKGETDLAAVPANLASVLYNNTKGGVEVIAINTLGVLYIVDTSGSVSEVSDLKGKTIYASGKGSTPEYALDYILNGNGIDPAADVQIEWKSEHAECLAALLEDPEGIAMLPQPFVTTAQMKNDSIQVVLDLSAEWDRLQEGSDTPSGMITGVMVARTEFVENHPEEVNAFLEAYADSVAFVNENVDEAAALVGGYDIVPEAVAKTALPACNITMISGAEMTEKLSGYLQVLYDANPEAVGGALPEEGFYYTSAE